ncbi:MAG: aldo/keto reductase [Solobacterium sp.]|nr:aldo/keto reductase [Solobacterium sp.]
MNYFTLNNGITMPALGLGTSNLKGIDCEDAVAFALQNGYEHIDTASSYYNEKAVGRGIAKSRVAREKMFITVKVWPSDYEHAKEAVQGSFARLGIDYADMLIVHHPTGDYDACYKAFEELYQEGKTRSIGLSNFSKTQILHFLNDFTIAPSLVTVEAHPYFPQEELHEFLNAHQLVLEAWYPLGHGDENLTKEPILLELAEKYQKSVVQILLRWHIQMGNSVLPGSKTPSHIADNINIFDFALTKEDMEKIASLNKHQPYKEFNDEMYTRFLNWKPDWNDQE